jgi:hypothetical protein
MHCRNYRDSHTNSLVSSTCLYSDHSGILMAPAFIYYFQYSSLVIHSGYDPLDGSYDFNLLLYSLLMNLVLEMTTDMVCWYYESKEIDLVLTWKSISRKNLFYYRMLPLFLIVSTGGLLFLTFALHAEPGQGDCEFLSRCMPYPCDCYYQEDLWVNNNFTASSKPPPLPHFFQYACGLIANNQTDLLLSRSFNFFQ